MLTCSIKSAVGSTLHVVGAESAVKLVASVAVGVPVGRVQPAPVGIEHNVGIDGGTLASGGTLLVTHGRVVLSS